MAESYRPLSHVLDQVQSSVHGDSITIREVTDTLGNKSFSSLMLVFSLISTSPASAIPGVTATVAAIVFILAVQLMVGRESVWLPDFITSRRLSTAKLRKGLKWLRKPVRYAERFLKPRMTFLFHRRWLWLPLSLIVALTLFMPFMEVIPMSGSLASAVIALFAAGLLMRDGGLVVFSLVPLSVLPLAVWYFGFNG